MITMEDIWEESKKHEKEREEFKKEIRRMQIKELRNKGLEPMFDEDGNNLSTPQKQTWDHPNTVENSTATVLWVVVLLVGSIFKGNWVIWIIATVIWYRFITRHDR